MRAYNRGHINQECRVNENKTNAAAAVASIKAEHTAFELDYYYCNNIIRYG